jgi:hypothetical protein
MDVQGISGSGAIGGDGTSHDIGDIALAVALLEIETLDGEIGTRLTAMEQLNAVRKAYNDRIGELTALFDGTTGDTVWIPASKAERLNYAWSNDANGGEGGPAGQPAEEGPLGSAGYRIQAADGSIMSAGDVRGPGESGDKGAWGLVTYRTSDRATAEADAARCGGTVVVKASREDVQHEIDRLRDCADNLSADSEIGMLKLNRLLARRNQTLQLTSNVMSSVHQSAMGIINNIKV